MRQYPEQIVYSSRYKDDTHEYRHVKLPRHIWKTARKLLMEREEQILTEEEWRYTLNIQQSGGWEMYGQWLAEPFILLFRRPLLDSEKQGE